MVSRLPESIAGHRAPHAGRSGREWPSSRLPIRPRRPGIAPAGGASPGLGFNLRSAGFRWPGSISINTRVVGVSPKAYVGARRIERMKSTLRQGHTVSRATYDAGYGSGSRAYEHASAGLGMTPGTYRKGGRGLRIAYSLVPTSVGQLLAAATDRGLCAVMLGDDATELENQLQGEYPAAALERNDTALSQYIGLILERLSGGEDAMLPLDVGGTAFQWQVWEALQRIPPGETRSYQTLAREIGRPTAARAVARACAGNHVALVIPCHRAVREHGEPGGYRWGAERKRQLLEQERAHRDSRSEVTVPA
jgi:AraC family transcriptional regulator of adaptative response/methylated-DNA-[protein]-cysteine methyltransferase